MAKFSDWFVGTPITVLCILLGAWILSHLARRYLGRLISAAVAQHDSRSPRVSSGGSAWASRPDELDPRREARSQSIAGVVGSTTAVIIWVIALITVLGEVGIDLGPLIAGAGIAGVALGFGAQSIVKDFLAGLFVLIEDQYGIGDVVDLGEASGTVEEISLRATVLRAQDGTVWHVPNGEVVRVGNRSQLWSVAVVDVTVAYSSDLARGADGHPAHRGRRVRVGRLEGPGPGTTESARCRGVRRPSVSRFGSSSRRRPERSGHCSEHCARRSRSRSMRRGIELAVQRLQ